MEPEAPPEKYAARACPRCVVLVLSTGLPNRRSAAHAYGTSFLLRRLQSDGYAPERRVALRKKTPRGHAPDKHAPTLFKVLVHVRAFFRSHDCNNEGRSLSTCPNGSEIAVAAPRRALTTLSYDKVTSPLCAWKPELPQHYGVPGHTVCLSFAWAT